LYVQNGFFHSWFLTKIVYRFRIRHVILFLLSSPPTTTIICFFTPCSYHKTTSLHQEYQIHSVNLHCYYCHHHN
jgi:hypothetical protein